MVGVLLHAALVTLQPPDARIKGNVHVPIYLRHTRLRADAGYTLVYLSLLVLIPLGALFLKTTELVGAVHRHRQRARVLAALKLSFGTAFAAAMLNGVIGTLLAWVLVRYRFPGRKIIEAMIDLPFALPTAVAGIASPRCTRRTDRSASSLPTWASRSPTVRWASPWH